MLPVGNALLYRQLIDAWSMRYWQPGPLSGQNGYDHFFDAFAKFGAATAGQTGQMLAESLATDDEGVSRSELSREFLKAAEEQGLGYLQLKALARNSLEYAFLPGQSL